MLTRKQRLVALGVLTFQQAGSALITSGLGALAPFFASTLLLSRTEIGMLSGVIGVTWILTSSSAGVLVDRFDERALLLASGLAMAVALCAAAAVERFDWLLLWLTVFGILAAFSTPAGGRAITLWFTRSRAIAMGIRQGGVPIGGFLAALILPPIAAHYDYRASLYAAAIFIIITSAGVLILPKPAFPAVRKRHVAHVWREMRAFARDPRSILLSIAQVDHNVAQTCSSSFLSLSLLALAHVSIVDAVLALAVMQIGSIAGRFGWGLLSDRALGGERLIPVAAASVIGAGAELFFAFHHPVATVPIRIAIFVCALLLGASIAGCNGLFAAAQTEVAGPDLAGSALGLAAGRTSFGLAFAPPLFGLVADHLGYSAAWLILAAVTLLGVVPALQARRVIAAYKPEAA